MLRKIYNLLSVFSVIWVLMRVRLSAALAPTDIVGVLDVMPMARRRRDSYLCLHGNGNFDRDIGQLGSHFENLDIRFNWHFDVNLFFISLRH